MRHIRIMGVALIGALALSLTAPMAWAEELGPEPNTETPTFSSRLAEITESGITDPVEIAAELSLPAEGGGSINLDDYGNVLTSVYFDEAPSESLLEQIRALGTLEKLHSITAAAAVRIDPARLELLQSLPGVTGVTPALTPMTHAEMRGEASFAQRTPITQATGGVAANACNPLPIDADAALRTDLARERFGVDGTGVTIGIISDSFALSDQATTWREDVSAGVLPGPSNPCGHLEPVEVLFDDMDPAVGLDEGRAMAHLVHGIAPGAKILFTSVGQSDLEFADRITMLAEEGADIIVDDVSSNEEPYFQQSYISNAIETAKRVHGIAYFSAVGNDTQVTQLTQGAGAPLGSWQTTAYRPMPCPDWVEVEAAEYDCLDFDPSEAEVAYDRMIIWYDYDLKIFASIGEPLGGVTTSYEIHFYHDQGVPGADPVELGHGLHSYGGLLPGLSGVVSLNANTMVRMVFVRTGYDPAADLPPVYISFTDGGGGAIAGRFFMGNGSTDVVGHTAFGHNADGQAISVGAMHWNDPQRIRSFSSLGPVTLHFEPQESGSQQPAARYAEPLVINAPSIATVDGVRTTFFDRIDAGGAADEYRFYGTSAAAPIAAAAFALGKQYAPTMPSDDMTELMLQAARANTVQPENPYSNFGFTNEQVFGAGLFDAVGTLERLPIEGLSALSPSMDSISVSWGASIGLPATLVLDLYDEGTTPRTLVETVPLPADVTTHTFEGLQTSHDYSAELTATFDSTNVARGAVAISTTAAPAPEPDPAPEPEPEPEPDPVPDPAPDPAPVPDPTPTPDPDPDSEPTPDPDPADDSTPDLNSQRSPDRLSNDQTAAGSGGLPNTGSGDTMLWFAGAGALLALGAIALAASLRSRAKHAASHLS